MGRLNPRRETKLQGKNGDRKMGKLEKTTKMRKVLGVNGGGETEQSGASCDKAKRAIEHVCVDGRSQLLCTTSERWR